MANEDLSGRLARWSLKLQAFDFKIEHRKGAQNVVPDTLSRIFVDALNVTSDTSEIDLSSPHFTSEEYRSLMENVQLNGDRYPDVVVSDGFVYKRTEFCRGDAIQEDRAWKLWVPPELREKLLTTAHTAVSSGHGGIHKTLASLKETYYWPGMVKEVQALIKGCDVCKCSKTGSYMHKPLMGNQVITERPFQRLYIDFMGPYPRSKEGNTCLFVCLDHFSKFVFLKPMRKACATNVVKFLENEVFKIFGVPESLHSDNGKQFVSGVFRQFLEGFGVNHVKTGFYSPQANASERVHRSVLQMVRAY